VCATPPELIRTKADERAVADGCWVDLAAAERVRTFFRKFLRHSKGEWAGQTFELLEWEWTDLVLPLFGWMRPDGTRRFRRAYAEVAKKNGKALALNTPLPTPSGWVSMGDVDVGDALFDENGDTCSVVAVTDVLLGRPCYRVSFSDGTSVVADAEHEWAVRSLSKERSLILTTKEIAGSVSTRADGARNYSIPVAGKLNSRPSSLRKQARLRPAPPRLARSTTRQITSVEPVGSVPVRCIQVDSPSSLYLCGEGMVPTHNSTLCAGLSLYLLIADGESGAEVYSAAADREQASIVFREAASMVGASTELSGHVQVIPSTKRLVFPRTGSFYHALSADAYRQEGLNIHGLIFDELHAQKTRELWDTLTYGGIARRQPLLIAITTAGVDRDSICREQHKYAKQILDGIIDDWSFFPYIVAADAEDDWTAPATWRKANPSFGATVKEEEFAEACAEARASPAKENSFKRYRLNLWTQQEVRWLQLSAWDECAGPIDDAAVKDLPCWGGLDLSTKLDLTAFAAMFRRRDGHYLWLPYFWIPEDTAAERERKDKVPYLTWARQGLIELTPGNVIDYDRVVKRVCELCQKYGLRDIGVDRWQAEHAMQKLAGQGLDVVPYGQGFHDMSEPTKEMEKLIVGKQISHGGNPVLRWCANNVAVDTDAAGNLKPNKAKSTERIDGIVAGIIALGRALVSPDGSIYDRRGVVFV